MLRTRGRRVAAAAVASSGLFVHSKADAYCDLKPLRNMHEVLATGPLARRYISASPLDAASWLVTFVVTDLTSKTRAAQQQIIQLSRSPPKLTAALPADASCHVTRSMQHGLELRQMPVEDGKKMAVEVWSTESGVRLARTVLNGAGVKLLPPGVFGRPAFSPSGARVTMTLDYPHRDPNG